MLTTGGTRRLYVLPNGEDQVFESSSLVCVSHLCFSLYVSRGNLPSVSAYCRSSPAVSLTQAFYIFLYHHGGVKRHLLNSYFPLMFDAVSTNRDFFNPIDTNFLLIMFPVGHKLFRGHILPFHLSHSRQVDTDSFKLHNKQKMDLLESQLLEFGVAGFGCGP